MTRVRNSPSRIRTTLSSGEPVANLALGQFALVDAGVLDQMIGVARLTREDIVLEIGPGGGVLTSRLAPLCKRLICVEVDVRWRSRLDPIARRYPNVEIDYADILSIDIPVIDKVVSSIPYHIVEPLIDRMRWHRIERMVLITGERFARSVTACETSAFFGRMSVVAQAYYRARIEMRVPPTSFSPRPRVNSALVVLEAIDKDVLAVTNPQMFILRELLEQEDKLLRNALREAFIRWSAHTPEMLTIRSARAIVAGSDFDPKTLASSMRAISNPALVSLCVCIRRGIQLHRRASRLERD